MHPLGVVPIEPGKELAVEGLDVHPEVRAVIVSELLLHRTVEPLGMSILFGCPRAGVIVGEMKLEKRGAEMLLELTAVISQDEGEGEWEDRAAQREEVSRCERGMRRSGKGEPKAGIEVNEGDDIPPCPIDVLLEGVEGDHMPRVPSHQSPRLPQGLCPRQRLDSSHTGDAKRHHPEAA